MTVNLVKILRNLIMAGYSPEHDVCGVSDPFLQVKILRLLRLMGRNDAEASEAMTDILTQVATNTESSKNVGNAILYETVLSIMDIKSDSGLRVLGVNILGRFLLNTDKNIRFVALTTLYKTVQADYNAVQRHRSTILECLKDADVSIRRKAMELCFALINSNNIKTMAKELLVFLEKADAELKSVCSSNLCLAAEQYSPGSKWQIDCIIQVLKIAGNYVRDDLVCTLVQLISSSPPHLHSYSVHCLWKQLNGDLQSKQPLVQVCSYVIGEYAELLTTADPEVVDSEAVDPESVVSAMEKIATNHLMNIVTREYALSTLIKLSVRFPHLSASIKTITDFFSCHLQSELQQRAIEFSVLFTKHDSLRSSILEKMPPMKMSDRRHLESQSIDSTVSGQEKSYNGQSQDTLGFSDVSQAVRCDALVDLLGIDLNTTSSSLDMNLIFD